jgi:hypothetical protein
MLPTIHQLFTLLKKQVKCISPSGPSVALARSQSTGDQQGVHSPSVFAPAVFCWHVSIATTSFISQKHFRPGGMGPPVWTRSVGAVRDTPVADYPTPGISTTRVALHIALRSLFRHFFPLCWSPNMNNHSSVVANSDRRSEYVHWVHTCIGIAIQCDGAKITPRIPSTLFSRSIGR